MRLSHWTPAPVISPPKGFETLREVTARVGERPRVPRTARELMHAASLRCQKGGHERKGTECLECERIVSIRPSPGRSYVMVRCLWTELDVVEAVMTRAFATVTVEASATLGHADEIAGRESVHHLLVVERGDVVGVVCRCDLAKPGSQAGQLPVAGAIERELWTVPVSTSLAEAADVMERLDVGVLMVADEANLLGIVTMRDLGLTLRGHGS